MENDIKLNKFIEGELVQLSPLEKRSIELKAEADSVKINDKDTLKEAKKIKKALVSHRTSVKDMRLTFTRKLDNMKDQFIKKQDEVLEASIAGEAIVKEKIDDYEKEQKRLKEIEENRVKDIVSKFTIPELDRKVTTKEDVARARAAIKMELGLLDPKDRAKVAIKNQVAVVREWLDELDQFITDRDEQARVAEAQRIEQERLDADRKKLEDEKAAAQARINEKLKEQEDDGLRTLKDATDDSHQTIMDGAETGLEMSANGMVADPIVIPDHDHDQVHIGIDTGIGELYTHEGVSAINSIASRMGEKMANETDKRIRQLLIENGISVHEDDMTTTLNEMNESGYRLIKETDGYYGVRTTRYTLVKVIDKIDISFNVETNMGEI